MLCYILGALAISRRCRDLGYMGDLQFSIFFFGGGAGGGGGGRGGWGSSTALYLDQPSWYSQVLYHGECSEKGFGGRV